MANHSKLRRMSNRTETRGDAIMRSAYARPGSIRVLARKSTRGHGQVTVEVASGGGVIVASQDHRWPMKDEESAMAWLDCL